MNNRLKDFYMGVATSAASLSRCVRLQVGCVIVKDDNILSFSWNGTPAGWDNCCEERIYMDSDAGGWLDPETIELNWPYSDADDNRYKLQTLPEVIHSESNAIAKMAKHGYSALDATMFCTMSPCIDCAKLIYQSGIHTLYYEDGYRCTAGLDFLERVDVTVLHI